MIENVEIYRQLQEHLDKMPIGFPKAKSGSDIRLLKHLFSPEEAKIAMLLRFGWLRDLEPLETIYERAKDTDLSINELEQILDRMVKNGSIMFKKEGGKKYFGNALLAVGMFEFQVDQLTEGFVKDFRDYYREVWLFEAIRVKGAQMRVIPVEHSIEPKHHIANYDDLEKLIESTEGPFMVINCICRQMKDILDEPCKKTSRRELCLGFGKGAQIFIDLERGRSISREDALEVLRKNEEDGLVLQPDDTLELCFICSCCSCCCENLSNYVLMPNPGSFIITNYFAEVDTELCSGCGTCVEICPMKAFKLKDEISILKRKRCIGCGNCVVKCPSEAINLEQKERQFTPFPTMDDLFDRIKARKKRLDEKK